MKTNVSIFIPHIGCPNKCSFCNQYFITGQLKAPDAYDVNNTILKSLENIHLNEKSEIAFFGGSFTALERNYMLQLLDTAKPYIETGKFSGIRISTRPDCINEEILEILKKHYVTSIELGAQSMDDKVLKANYRGHSSDDVYTSSILIKKHNFELGLQIMPGLYKSNFESDYNTALEVINIHPDTVRIYPTITLHNTHLEKLYNEGKYKPYGLEETVSFCSKLVLLFRKNDINIIKLGLHSEREVLENYVSGPFHPAFKELCESKIYLDKTLEILLSSDKGDYTITVGSGCLSKMKGQRSSNIKYLKEIGYNCKIQENPSIQYLEISVN